MLQFLTCAHKTDGGKQKQVIKGKNTFYITVIFTTIIFNTYSSSVNWSNKRSVSCFFFYLRFPCFAGLPTSLCLIACMSPQAFVPCKKKVGEEDGVGWTCMPYVKERIQDILVVVDARVST
jgi:hypothetical protein